MSDHSGVSGSLYVVGTPIGNLEDITLRALRILQTVDLIAAEDTRHTGKLLQHFQIKTPQLSYHQHNRLSREQDLIEKLQQGISIALVTDAGMPGISDPGYELVKAAISAGVRVIPIPGVSASITALSVSGLSTERFVFEGFLPTKNHDRRSHLAALKQESRTLIFYEAPHRLLATLRELAEFFGLERQIVIGREITKLHETFWRGQLAGAIAFYETTEAIKGELTLVLAGKPVTEKILVSELAIQAELKQLLNQGMTRSQASRYLADLTCLSRRDIYQIALQIETES